MRGGACHKRSSVLRPPSSILVFVFPAPSASAAVTIALSKKVRPRAKKSLTAQLPTFTVARIRKEVTSAMAAKKKATKKKTTKKTTKKK
jgi:hypothetical protein